MLLVVVRPGLMLPRLGQFRSALLDQPLSLGIRKHLLTLFEQLQSAPIVPQMGETNSFPLLCRDVTRTRQQDIIAIFRRTTEVLCLTLCCTVHYDCCKVAIASGY
jgi:hypothetical protein